MDAAMRAKRYQLPPTSQPVRQSSVAHEPYGLCVGLCLSRERAAMMKQRVEGEMMMGGGNGSPYGGPQQGGAFPYGMSPEERVSQASPHRV